MNPFSYSSLLTLLSTPSQNTDQGYWPLDHVDVASFGFNEGPQTAKDWLLEALDPKYITFDLFELLQSPASDQTVSERLVDLLGFENLDLIPQILSRRPDLRQESTDDAIDPIVPLDTTTRAVYQPANRSQITFQTDQEIALAKRARAALRKTNGNTHLIDRLSLADMHDQRQRDLEAAANRDWRPAKKADTEPERYPHVYSTNTSGSNLTAWGERFVLPEGTTHEMHDKYEEITIPASVQPRQMINERVIAIDQLDDLAKGSFPGYTTLNRLQSLVFDIAYKTNENMLVCAPTGAGKTDVAVLTILRAIAQYAQPQSTSRGMELASKDFKIVYVAPMKALAAEIVRKMTKRLTWLGIQVRELTGDMQLSRAEIAKTQMIVTTPEKWAVVTNKPSADGDLATQVKLLIIDEVHLLHDDRGAVIETLVARTLRQVESNQGLIRIVGLSATLPNYVDVADFLGVNRYQGLFYFDSSFRPVPLEQHFIGVKGKAGSNVSRANLEEATFDKVSELVKEGHQVMVFVHARKETVKTAQYLRERATGEGLMDLFDCSEHPRYEIFKRDISTSRNREMKELFQFGFGIHHAGMLRTDRTLSERLFENGLTKVLCCTATLAWGINLPAYAVIIKGTQVYDSAKGAFVDLSILDVLQIFGRAGRPQYESQGVGYICTTADKVNEYVSAITQQVPIESKFVQGMIDALNAEIALGTVSNLDEGVRWIGYTFLFVRMRKNPMVYGISPTDVLDDPLLGQKRHSLMTFAAKRLAEYKMIVFDVDTSALVATDLGRIAAKYYLKAASIELFNSSFKPNVTEADTLHVLSRSCEFNQIVVRENELQELGLLVESAQCEIQGGVQSSAGKVNALLQAYISRQSVADFALISDMAYVAQNAARIARSLFEIAIAQRWSIAALTSLSICKAIEKRMWPFQNPLEQMDLKRDLMFNIKTKIDDWTIEELCEAPKTDVASALGVDDRLATVVMDAARQIPRLKIETLVQPLSNDLLRVTIMLTPKFKWSEKSHHASIMFWLWVAEASTSTILQSVTLNLRSATETIVHKFFVAFDQLPKALQIVLVPNDWMTDQEASLSSLEKLALPEPLPSQAATTLSIADLEAIDPIVAMSLTDAAALLPFHTLSKTAANVVITTPNLHNTIGWSILAIKRSLQISTGIILVLGRQTGCNLLKAAVIPEFGSRLHVVPLRGLASSTETNIAAFEDPKDVLEVVLAQSPKWLDNLRLIICTDLHTLDTQYELAVSSLCRNTPRARFVGLGFSTQSNGSLASWLGAPSNHCFAFGPMQSSSFSRLSIEELEPATPALLITKMTHRVIASPHSVDRRKMCICSSKSQVLAATATFIKSRADDALRDAYVGDRDLLQQAALQVQHTDPIVAEALTHGIVLFISSLPQHARTFIKRIFDAGHARLLLTTKDQAIRHSLLADEVVVLGTRHTVVNLQGQRQFDTYSFEDILRLRDLAVPEHGRCVLMCEHDQAHLYTRFLRDGYLLESSLLEPEAVDYLDRSLMLEILTCRKSIAKAELMGFLSKTFLASRISSNPAYYGANSARSGASFLSRQLDARLAHLRSLCLVVEDRTGSLQATHLAKVSRARIPLLRQLKQLIALDMKDLCGLAQTNECVEAASLAASDLWTYYLKLPKKLRDQLALQQESIQAAANTVLIAGFRLSRGLPLESPLAVVQANLLLALCKAS